MKRLSNLVTEAEENAAHKQAVSMGLKYRGFGYWEDPSSGNVKFKTENDQLVPVDEVEEAEKGTPKGSGGPGEVGPAGPGDLGTGAQMAQMSGAMPTPPQVGTLPLGAPEPGEEIAQTTLEWEPGPDGSTCVDSGIPDAKVPEDSFVSRTNNLKWGAGPDGTNYSNINYDELLKDLRAPGLDNFLNRMRTQQKVDGGMSENVTFFDMFMAEAPMQAGMGPQSAADEAKAQGLTYSGYGYWRDKTGQVVAKTVDNNLTYLDQGPQAQTASTLDMGNPTSQVSGQTPASKARSMGLVSNGSGGYTDQEGNIIARTVNNELVFYDSRAGGGAVSDGSGGAQLTQSAPSWVDPVTGLIVVPPAQPESPEEINAVPDAVPATAPAGYDAFVNQKKKEAYRQNYIETQANQEIANQQAEVDNAYARHPAAQQFQSEMNEKMDAAAGSGDVHREGAAALVRQNMEDNADTYAGYFDAIPGDQHPALSAELRRLVVAQSKATHAINNIDDDSVPLEYSLGTGTARKAQDSINKMLDDNNPDIEVYPKMTRKTEPPEMIEGNGIAYDLTFTRLQGFNSVIARETNDTLRNMGSNMRVDDNPKIVDIEWRVDMDSPPSADTRRGRQRSQDSVGSFSTETNREILGPAASKRTALNALKTWRQEVLPSLTAGTIVRADPMADKEEKDETGSEKDNVRQRIYSLAGFGKRDRSDSTGGMYGIVMSDENGQNQLIPVNPDEKQLERMQVNEGYLRFLDGPLNMQEHILLEQFLL